MRRKDYPCNTKWCECCLPLLDDELQDDTCTLCRRFYEDLARKES